MLNTRGVVDKKDLINEGGLDKREGGRWEFLRLDNTEILYFYSEIQFSLLTTSKN